VKKKKKPPKPPSIPPPDEVKSKELEELEASPKPKKIEDKPTPSTKKALKVETVK
jgi:hypothetical protein